jgi:hypothetical protein
MNSELDGLRKEMTRQEFLEKYLKPAAGCPDQFGLITLPAEKCSFPDKCKWCYCSAVADIHFKDDMQAIKEMATEDRYKIHESLCDSMKDLYKTKNKDYGNSFAKRRKEYGNTAILIRLEDKFERLKHLMLSTELMVKTETIEDTLTDLANYCLLELVERKLEQEGEKV